VCALGALLPFLSAYQTDPGLVPITDNLLTGVFSVPKAKKINKSPSREESGMLKSY
jgi:hypothetical protein